MLLQKLEWLNEWHENSSQNLSLSHAFPAHTHIFFLSLSLILFSQIYFPLFAFSLAISLSISPLVSSKFNLNLKNKWLHSPTLTDTWFEKSWFEKILKLKIEYPQPILRCCLQVYDS